MIRWFKAWKKRRQAKKLQKEYLSYLEAVERALQTTDDPKLIASYKRSAEVLAASLGVTVEPPNSRGKGT